MGFTLVTITHQFDDDTSTATGTVVAQLSQTMSNGTETHVVGETVEGTLSSGLLSIVLPATDDTGTTFIGTPGPGTWLITFNLTDAQERAETYAIQVPHATTPVDLATLLPGPPQIG